MASYLEIYNDKNKLIVDDDTERLRLTRTSILTNCCIVSRTEHLGVSGYSVELNVETIAVIDVPLSSNETLMAFKITNPNNTNFDKQMGLIGIVVNRWGNGYRFWLYGADYSNYSMADAAHIRKITDNIKCYFYGNGVEATDKFGLQIFNSSGKQIFHSSNVVLNISSVYQVGYGKISKSYDIPYVNTGISCNKALLVHSIFSFPCSFRNSNSYGIGVCGFYSENNIYKMHPFFISRKAVCGGVSKYNVFYIVDVPD